MELNEIKKALYKQKPIANLWGVSGHANYYETSIGDHKVKFRVPISEMGDTKFEDQMPAQLLIRWIKN